jgi:TatD DNase family protein
MHCYSGHLPLAIDLMKEGFHISFAGPVTFKNARKSHEVAAHIPLDRLLIETDCPYLTPEPLRGKSNEPAYVVHVAEAIARLRRKPVEEIAYLTSRNAAQVYRLNK